MGEGAAHPKFYYVDPPLQAVKDEMSVKINWNISHVQRPIFIALIDLRSLRGLLVGGRGVDRPQPMMALVSMGPLPSPNLFKVIHWGPPYIYNQAVGWSSTERPSCWSMYSILSVIPRATLSLSLSLSLSLLLLLTSYIFMSTYPVAGNSGSCLSPPRFLISVSCPAGGIPFRSVEIFDRDIPLRIPCRPGVT